jgi:hypothetical protein
MSSIKLNFALHEAQQEIYNDPARFKVVAAGRRFGKTFLALIMCIIVALQERNRYGDPYPMQAEVLYIGVTLEQARRNAWKLLKMLAEPVIMQDKNGRPMVHENNSTVTLLNGVTIRLLGMDSPDAARGMSIRYAVLDEYAQMPEMVFPEIIRPALMDTGGGALFIGTPKGRNHFFELFYRTQKGDRGPDWKAFNYSSARNTFLRAEELVAAEAELTNGSEHLRQQEILANFMEPVGNVLMPANFPIDSNEPTEGAWKIAVDLAGFVKDADRGREIRQRDDTAIAIVKVHPVDMSAKSRYMAYGWWVKKVIAGKWDVRSTAALIAQAMRDHPGAELGIEQGALHAAVEPYLREYFNEYGLPYAVTELKHGNQNKQDRIRWALDGRSTKGRIKIAKGDWNEEFYDQVGNFPSPRVRDDYIDAISYVDQMSETVYYDMDSLNDYQFVPMDEIAGY